MVRTADPTRQPLHRLGKRSRPPPNGTPNGPGSGPVRFDGPGTAGYPAVRPAPPVPGGETAYGSRDRGVRVPAGVTANAPPGRGPARGRGAPVAGGGLRGP